MKSTPRARWKHVLVLALVAVIATALAACGDDDDEAPPRPQGISFGEAQGIEPETPKNKALKQLGKEPVLTSGPTENSPGGCVYYAMEGEALSDVWAFCFDEDDGLHLAATLRSPTQPAAPEGAFPAREVLIARADAICQSEYGNLNGITKDVGKALDAFAAQPTAANREAVGDAIADFIDNLEVTYERLAAFDAPTDELESFTAYLDSLQSQIDTLKEARTAFLGGDQKTYNELGKEFTEIGKTAKEHAAAYGFSFCSASSFG